MRKRLRIDITETDEISCVELSGIIDEDNGLADVTARINRPLVAINTADIERINSCGGRDWVTWLGELGKTGKLAYLVRCPPVIISQVNLVQNFVGTGSIVSFYCPYFCPQCNCENLVLVEVAEALRTLPFTAPTCRCDTCDFPLEFDEIESSYFAFLEQMKKRPVDSRLAEKLLRLSKSDGRIRKRPTSQLMVAVTGSASTLSTPTVLSGQFQGLLAPSSVGQDRPARPPQHHGLLYLVIVLLAAATGMLAYLILQWR